MELQERVLTKNESHFGFPCPAGTEIDFFERSGTLAGPVVYRGVELPGGSRFSHDVDLGAPLGGARSGAPDRRWSRR